MATPQPTTTLGQYASLTAGIALRPVRALAFWVGVVLPFVALTLAVAGTTDPLALGTVLAAAAVALALGRDHAQPA